MYVLKYPWCWQRRDLCRKWVHLYEKYAACHFIEERHHLRSGGSWKPKLWGGVSQKLGGVWPWICLHRRTYKVTNVCIYKKLPPTKFYLLVIGEWQRAWGGNWHVLLSHRVRIKKNKQLSRHQGFSNYSLHECGKYYSLREFWFTLDEEQGDMGRLHNRHSQGPGGVVASSTPAHSSMGRMVPCFQTLKLYHAGQRSVTLYS